MKRRMPGHLLRRGSNLECAARNHRFCTDNSTHFAINEKIKRHTIGAQRECGLAMLSKRD